MTGTTQWHFITAEYPPDPGGVADYTRLLATALASRGEVVHVWAPSGSRDGASPEGVAVHRISTFGARGLREMDEGLRALPGPRRLFLQYVPTVFGLRGMNVPLIRWLRARTEEVWVQFHEVALGWHLWRRPDLHLTNAVQLWMASALARRAQRLFVSIEGWLPRLGPEARRAEWLPIPSNVPVSVSPAERADARAALGTGPWIAHFGTYGAGVTRDLVPALRAIARRQEEVRFLLLGRGAEAVARELSPGRALATGELSASAVAARLSVADVALQPFPDGISARRTSAMAALALGVPIVTTRGHLTDSVWNEEVVALAPVSEPEELARLCLELLSEPARRAELGRRGARLYAERFSLERTLETLVPLTGATLARQS